MPRQSWLAAIALLAALSTPHAGAHALDVAYPDWKGQWERLGGGQFDPGKRPGRGQQPPLTAEYQAVWEANLAEEAAGGQTYNPMASCIPTGMPRMMTAYQPMEIIVTPDVTWISMAFLRELRRVYTDGRDWPQVLVPSYAGLFDRSVDRCGRRRTARSARHRDAGHARSAHFREQRHSSASGWSDRGEGADLPRPGRSRHAARRNHHPLPLPASGGGLGWGTRPWTVLKSYRRVADPTWIEDVCTENNNYAFIGKDSYFLSPDGYLMPTRKDQPPPRLRGFEAAPR